MAKDQFIGLSRSLKRNVPIGTPVKVPEGYEAKKYNGVMALHWEAVKNAKKASRFENRVMREGSDLRADYLNYATPIEARRPIRSIGCFMTKTSRRQVSF